MKFTQIKKRRVLETWQHKNRKTGLVSFVFRNPNGNYYFTISCFIKRCGLQECVKDGCDMYVYYNSLDQGLVYGNFNDCREDVIRWYMVWSE